MKTIIYFIKEKENKLLFVSHICVYFFLRLLKYLQKLSGYFSCFRGPGRHQTSSVGGGVWRRPGGGGGGQHLTGISPRWSFVVDLISVTSPYCRGIISLSLLHKVEGMTPVTKHVYKYILEVEVGMNRKKFCFLFPLNCYQSYRSDHIWFSGPLVTLYILWNINRSPRLELDECFLILFSNAQTMSS